jgi:predicted short-subunit dehydrogenase-like oxidoreductase (DUF2520 family)
MTAIRIVGNLPLGRALGKAWWDAGCNVRTDACLTSGIEAAAQRTDVLVLATSDSDVAGVAARVPPSEGTLVIHVSPAVGLSVLAPHGRRGSISPMHPLGAEPTAQELSGMLWAVSGDAECRRLVYLINGWPITVPEMRQERYYELLRQVSFRLADLLRDLAKVSDDVGLDRWVFMRLIEAVVTDSCAPCGDARCKVNDQSRPSQLESTDVLRTLPLAMAGR